MSTHEHNIIDVSDPHYVIDIKNRTINAEGSEKVLLIQGDHNSERFSFDIPRMIEGHDVLDCNHVQVHYWNKASSGRDEVKGFYEVPDMPAKEGFTGDTVSFSWLISGDATTYEGKLMFSVMFYCVDENNNITYRWGTQINNSMSIVSSLAHTNDVINDNIDTFSEWENRIDEHIAESQNEFDKHIADFEANFNEYVTNSTNAINAELEGLDAKVDEKVDAKIEGYVDGDTIQPTEFATESEVGAIFAEETGDYEPGEYYVYSQVDTELDETSENPVQNKVIAAALKNTGSSGGGSNVTVDSELSAESENPVQNKVITEALDGKLEKDTTTGKSCCYTNHNGQTQMREIAAAMTSDISYNIGRIPTYRDPYGTNVANLTTGTPGGDFSCANKKYVDDLANTKVTQSTNNNGLQVYIRDNGVEKTRPLMAGALTNDNGNLSGYIPVYRRLVEGGSSELTTGTPSGDFSCVNLKYFNDNKGTKLYKHTRTIIFMEELDGETGTGVFTVSCVTNRTDPLIDIYEDTSESDPISTRLKFLYGKIIQSLTDGRNYADIVISPCVTDNYFYDAYDLYLTDYLLYEFSDKIKNRISNLQDEGITIIDFTIEEETVVAI